MNFVRFLVFYGFPLFFVTACAEAPEGEARSDQGAASTAKTKPYAFVRCDNHDESFRALSLDIVVPAKAKAGSALVQGVGQPVIGAQDQFKFSIVDLQYGASRNFVVASNVDGVTARDEGEASPGVGTVVGLIAASAPGEPSRTTVTVTTRVHGTTESIDYENCTISNEILLCNLLGPTACQDEPQAAK